MLLHLCAAYGRDESQPRRGFRPPRTRKKTSFKATTILSLQLERPRYAIQQVAGGTKLRRSLLDVYFVTVLSSLSLAVLANISLGNGFRAVFYFFLLKFCELCRSSFPTSDEGDRQRTHTTTDQGPRTKDLSTQGQGPRGKAPTSQAV
jgi:hypothetical protein